MRKYNLDTFEFSQAYPLFFDKLEKANWFLWNVLDTLGEPTDGRLVSFLLNDPVGDGGQWDMFKAIVMKYGAVPKEAMPETACSEATRDMNCYLTRYLRNCAKCMRKAHGAGANFADLDSMRREILDDVQCYLTICLGQPPRLFDVRLKDKEGKLVLKDQFTPQEFLKTAVDISPDEYVSIISVPLEDRPYDAVFTVDRLGNVVEAGGVRYLNMELSEMKKLVVAQLRDDQPVWLGCDVAQNYLDDDGILGVDTLDIDGLFGIPIMHGFEKGDRLQYGESTMTHAMTIVGVNLDENNNPVLWKVENSWGKDHGKNGVDLMTDSWFDEYVYQVVVDRKYLSTRHREILDNCVPIVLPPWDPIGALAM
jgi:bleomycin hydrolase